ncbi:unnamed protein product [Brassica oleracea]
MISSSSKPQGLVEALTESTVLVHGIEEIIVTTSPATVSPVKSCLPSLVTLSNPSSTALGENQMQLETAVVGANKAVVDKDIVPGHGSNHLPALKGAWVKKLNVATSSHQCSGTSGVDPVLWPSLAVSSRSQTQVGVPLVNHNPPRMEDDARFPWAAKMNPSSRNLYRATEPEYLEDGTPKVTIPKHVLGLWHVDDCLMFVAHWTPKASLAIPEIRTIPVWVTLKKIPTILYSIPGISHIASGLGAPMATYKPRLDPILTDEAKILVEVELSKGFPSRIAANDENGFISMVDVDYAWLPSKCERCGQLGHKIKHCLQSATESHLVDTNLSENPSNGSLVVVETNTLLKSVQPDTSLLPSSDTTLSPPSSKFCLESSVVDIINGADVEDLVSLATISVLENMYMSPSIICINELLSLRLWSLPQHCHSSTLPLLKPHL